jgi:hypothetical protein
MPDELAQLPTGIDPQRQALLQSLFPLQQAQAAPAGAAPGGGGLQNYADLAQEQQTSLLQSGPAREAAGARAEGPRLAEEASSMIRPKMGWGDPGDPRDPNYKPPQGGFLHNLGRALMMIGGATAPGQAIQAQQYGPGIARYKGAQEALAEQIKASQAQAEGAEKEVGSLAQVAGRTIMGGAQVEKGQLSADAMNQRTQMLGQKALMQHQDALTRISAMTDIAAKRNATQIEVTRMRDEMMKEITGMKDVTQEDVARILAGSAQTLQNNKFFEDPSALGMLKRAFGVTPSQSPGGEQPVAGQTPLPPRAAATPKAGAVPAKGTIGYDPQGKPHAGDGIHPLPKGWSLKKPGT